MKNIHTPIETTSLVIELLKQDLKIFRLRQGLNDLGFESDAYYTDLPHIVYELMGINEELYEEADELYTELQHSLSIKQLADKVYLDVACVSLCTHLYKRFGEGGSLNIYYQ